MISYALNHQADKIFLTIGGTSCNDGGAGMLSSLKVKFYNKNNNEFIPQAKNLNEIYKIDFSNIAYVQPQGGCKNPPVVTIVMISLY